MAKVKVETTYDGWFFGMKMYCGSCLEPIHSGNVFCPKCGEKLETNKDRVIAELNLDANTSIEECVNIIKNEEHRFCEKYSGCKDCMLYIDMSHYRCGQSADEIKEWLEDYIMEWK